MGKCMMLTTSLFVTMGLLAAYPAVGAAAEHGGKAIGGAKWTLSLTKDYTPSPWTPPRSWMPFIRASSLARLARGVMEGFKGMPMLMFHQEISAG